MTVRRADDTIVLEDVCPVEDAETLLNQLQAGASLVDWSGCTHLHTACLQVMLVAGLPVVGQPANPTLARWAPALLAAAGQGDR
jgi:hypothetical protein